MEKYVIWMGIAIIQLIRIMLLKKDKSRLANHLTTLLLDPDSGEVFLGQLTADSEMERVKKINQKYAVGLTNSLKLAKAVAEH